MFLEAASNPSASALGTQITLSALSVLLIQKLKSWSAVPWISAGTDTLNRILSVILAVLSAVGVHVVWAAATTPGTYTLTFTGLTLAGIGMMAWGIIKQMAFNELAYRGTVKSVVPPPPAPVSVVGGQAGQ